MSDSTEPFLCPSCTAANQQNAIASLRDCLNALTDKVRVLKATVAALQKQDCGSNTKVVGVDNRNRETSLATSRTADGGNKLPWNTVVSRGSRGSRRKKTVPNSDVLHHAKETASRESHGSELNTAGHAKPQRKLVPIEDAKRVWGTLKSTTTSAITNAIKNLSPGLLAENLTVKRKYKATQDGTVKKWWFVVRGDKANLELLEKEWSKVAIQTGWKLEQAFRYDTSNTVPAQQSAEVNLDTYILQSC